MADTSSQLVLLRGGRQGSMHTRRLSPWCDSSRKRMLDVVLASLALPLALPLIAGLAVISAVRFRSNPFFVQERAGLDEVPFRVRKIRSLPVDFPEVGKHRLDDRAIGRWGQFLRATHMDELPQIFNVLDGSMSMVGPRPMIPEVLDELAPRDRRERARVRPGLTGVWQVTTAGSAPLQDCAWLDGSYVENASLTADIRLLVMTVNGYLGQPQPTPEEIVDRFGWHPVRIVQLAA